jgi:16S rRNA processing protein RimM
MSDAGDKLVTLGRVGGVYGVRGWVKVISFTAPRENILAYGDWTLEQGGAFRRYRLERGQRHGKGLVAKLAGVDDRDAADSLIGAGISVPRKALPACEAGEYYWTDLEGLLVQNLSGIRLGVVDHLLATGAHDVLVLDGGERLIPFASPEVVRRVDLEAGVIVVDWEPDFGTD